MVFGFLWPGADIVEWASIASRTTSSTVVTAEEDECVVGDVFVLGFDYRFEDFICLLGSVCMDESKTVADTVDVRIYCDIRRIPKDMEDNFGGFDTYTWEGGEIGYGGLIVFGVWFWVFIDEWCDSLYSLLVELDEELGCGVDVSGFAVMQTDRGDGCVVFFLSHGDDIAGCLDGIE